MKPFARRFTHIGLTNNLSKYEVNRVLVFNYCNLVGFMAAFSRLIYILFFSSNHYSDLTILVNVLPLVICVIMAICLHYQKYALATYISFFTFPPALLLVFIFTHDYYVSFFLILYLIFPFFFLHKAGNIIMAFIFSVGCILLINSASDMRLLVYSGSYYEFDQGLAYIDCIFSVGFVFCALYAIKSLVWSYEKSIRSKNVELKELNQFKNKMFSIVSHDFRSPLAAVSQLLDILQRTPISQKDFTEYIYELNEQVHVTRELVENMLDWTKKQMDSQKIFARPTSLIDIVLENFELLAKQAAGKRIQLINEVTPADVALADKDMIIVVIRNLLSNAIKFSREEGYIKVKIARTDSESIVVEIEDNGIGIPPEKQSLIFGDEYYTSSGTSNEKGTGLGLKICEEFVQKNNGLLTFRSMPGSGTSFYMKLPVYKTQMFSSDTLYPGARINNLSGLLKTI